MGMATDSDFVQRSAAWAYEVRRTRNDVFEGELFADPAWDILLYLFISHHNRTRPSVGAVCDASGSPSTTALRWIEILCREGHILRDADPTDRRRAFLRISPAARAQVENVFKLAPLLYVNRTMRTRTSDKRLKFLEDENSRLKKLLIDLMLEKSNSKKTGE